VLSSTPSASAGSSSIDATPAVRELEQLCDQKGGTVVRTPYALVRCQEARSNKGFVTEQALCEEDVAGHFAAAPTFDRRNRTSWACSQGASSE
jgi:hypothetical protein